MVWQACKMAWKLKGKSINLYDLISHNFRNKMDGSLIARFSYPICDNIKKIKFLTSCEFWDLKKSFLSGIARYW